MNDTDTEAGVTQLLSQAYVPSRFAHGQFGMITSVADGPQTVQLQLQRAEFLERLSERNDLADVLSCDRQSRSRPDA